MCCVICTVPATLNGDVITRAQFEALQHAMKQLEVSTALTVFSYLSACRQKMLRLFWQRLIHNRISYSSVGNGSVLRLPGFCSKNEDSAHVVYKFCAAFLWILRTLSKKNTDLQALCSNFKQYQNQSWNHCRWWKNVDIYSTGQAL